MQRLKTVAGPVSVSVNLMQLPEFVIYVLGETSPAIEEVQRLLARLGYNVTATGYLDGNTRDAVAAFQRHFRPARVDGVVDVSTTATLHTLLAKRDALHKSVETS